MQIFFLGKPEFYRTLLSFIQYDALKSQLEAGETPKLSYIKKDGKKFILSIWAVPEEIGASSDTIWIFEEEN